MTNHSGGHGTRQQRSPSLSFQVALGYGSAIANCAKIPRPAGYSELLAPMRPFPLIYCADTRQLILWSQFLPTLPLVRRACVVNSDLRSL